MQWAIAMSDSWIKRAISLTSQILLDYFESITLLELKGAGLTSKIFVDYFAETMHAYSACSLVSIHAGLTELGFQVKSHSRRAS